MDYRLAQPSFSKGEIAPDLYGRFDVDAYAQSLRKARNVVILKYGGVTKRPGTRLVAEVYDASQPVRLVPFKFSIEQAYALELGQGYMRVAAAGGLVLNEEIAITGVTNEEHARITAAYHGYSVGQQVFLRGIDGALGDELNFRLCMVAAVIDDNNFRIDVNTRGMAIFSGAQGGITRTGDPEPDPPAPVIPDPVEPPPPPQTGGGGRPLGPNEQVP
ncbi:hypothetical protein [Sphingobium sp. YR657]|uniref:hypothetical protein n=1 Tax=Sphingobium sp. YR657 TaxID=1884366 RepID=UPI0031380959